MLPRALLRNRIGLTEPERDLLVAAVGGWGASRRLLDAVLPADPADVDRTVASFRAGPDAPDPAGLGLLRWGERPWALTATLQRLLRAQGDRTPCVEVLLDGVESPYHRAAAARSALLWRAPIPVSVA